VSTPAVAQKKRQKALAAFRRKNKVLEEVVDRERPDTLPSGLTDVAYCIWQSDADEVESFSTFTFYNPKNETERTAAEKGLKALAAMRRAAGAKKASKAVTVEDVKKQLKAEEMRSKSFASQYNGQLKLNEELVVRIRQLEQDLSRANKELAQVRPLRSLPSPRKTPQAPSKGARE
jgi:type II secretory pathway component PulJ